MDRTATYYGVRERLYALIGVWSLKCCNFISNSEHNFNKVMIHTMGIVVNSCSKILASSAADFGHDSLVRKHRSNLPQK